MLKLQRRACQTAYSRGAGDGSNERNHPGMGITSVTMVSRITAAAKTQSDVNSAGLFPESDLEPVKSPLIVSDDTRISIRRRYHMMVNPFSSGQVKTIAAASGGPVMQSAFGKQFWRALGVACGDVDPPNWQTRWSASRIR